jgi:hypothetical protein
MGIDLGFKVKADRDKNKITKLSKSNSPKQHRLVEQGSKEDVTVKSIIKENLHKDC